MRLPTFKRIPTNQEESQYLGRVNHYISKIAEAIDSQSLPIAAGESLKTNQGKWSNLFPKQGDLILEIGCHEGKTLCELAKRIPQFNFLGLDITYKRAFLTAQKIQQNQLENGFAVLGDARSICEIFSQAELAGCIIFFPDPWSKKVRQRKHRLIQNDFCANLATIIAKNGWLWFRTDSEEYFQEATHLLSLNGFKASQLPEIFRENHDILTTFQQHFMRANLPIFETFLRLG